MKKLLKTKKKEMVEMSLVQRFLTYIGLGPEHYYADSESHVQESSVMTAPTATAYRGQPNTTSWSGISETNNPVSPNPSINRIINAGHAEPRVVVPKTFESAQKIADLFVLNHPVVLNLDISDKKLARRIMDFASGICYVMDGKIKRVGNDMFLLTPRNSYLSDEDVATYLNEARNASYN